MGKQLRFMLSIYRRTESAALSDDIAARLWEHTPPLEGRGRAVRRKVNGRVTGWRPPRFARERGQGVRQIRNAKEFCKIAL